MLDGMNSDSLDKSSWKHREGCLAQPVQNMTGSNNFKNESYNKGRMEGAGYLRIVVVFLLNYYDFLFCFVFTTELILNRLWSILSCPSFIRHPILY